MKNLSHQSISLHQQNIKKFILDLIYYFDDQKPTVEYIAGEKFEHLISRLNHGNFPLRILLSICDRIKINLDQLIKNDIPWQRIKIDFSTDANIFQIKNALRIPEKYLHYAGTSISVIDSCLRYIYLSCNKYAAAMIRNRLNLTMLSLGQPNQLVNVNLVNDFMKMCVRDLCLDKQQLRSMALYTNLKTQRKQIIQLGSHTKSDYELLNLMVNHSKQYEINFDYQMKKQDQYVVISSRGKEEIHDGLKLLSLNCKEVVYFKKFTIESTNLIIGRNPMQVKKINTKIKNGIQSVEFIINKNNANYYLGS